MLQGYGRVLQGYLWLLILSQSWRALVSRSLLSVTLAVFTHSAPLLMDSVSLTLRPHSQRNTHFSPRETLRLTTSLLAFEPLLFGCHPPSVCPRNALEDCGDSQELTGILLQRVVTCAPVWGGDQGAVVFEHLPPPSWQHRTQHTASS